MNLLDVELFHDPQTTSYSVSLRFILRRVAPSLPAVHLYRHTLVKSFSLRALIVGETRVTLPLMQKYMPKWNQTGRLAEKLKGYHLNMHVSPK